MYSIYTSADGELKAPSSSTLRVRVCCIQTILFLALVCFDLLLAVATHQIYSSNGLPFKPADYVSAFFEAIQTFDMKEIGKGRSFYTFGLITSHGFAVLRHTLWHQSSNDGRGLSPSCCWTLILVRLRGSPDTLVEDNVRQQVFSFSLREWLTENLGKGG